VFYSFERHAQRVTKERQEGDVMNRKKRAELEVYINEPLVSKEEWIRIAPVSIVLLHGSEHSV